MNRPYAFRLYPRKREKAALETLRDQHREVYNAALAQCKNACEATGKTQSALSQWPYFRDWRHTYPDLILNASSLQHTLRRLDKAFAAFFRRVKAGEKAAGYPRFKGKDRFKSIEYTYGDGCKNRRKDKRQIVARLHEYVANQRRDFWHKLTFRLVHTYGLIALKALNLAFMTRNGHLSLSAHDAGLGAFQTILAYKAVDAGSHVTFVNPTYTSQACSGCGEMVEKDLSVRVHVCPSCHLQIDRNLNAARNILNLALKESSPPGSGGQALT